MRRRWSLPRQFALGVTVPWRGQRGALEREDPRANCLFSGNWRYWQLPLPGPGGCHRPSRPARANCSGLFIARDHPANRKSCLSISAGGGRLHRPGSAGVTGLSARGHAPASGAFSPHPLPLALHLNPPTWPPRSFPRVLRLRKVQRGTIAGGQAVSDKRSILSSPARERAAGPVRGMCAVIGSGMREPSQPPVSTVTAVRCHPSVQLSPREGRHSFSLLTRCKCPLSGWILKILDTSLCLYAK